MAVRFPSFARFPEVQCGVSERKDGSMRLYADGTRDREGGKNRARFFLSRGVRDDRAVAARLVHGSRSVVVGAHDGGKVIPDADALVTAETGVALMVTIADCFPVFFYDPAHCAVGIAHAGWRGLIAGIVPNVMAKMTSEFGSDPSATVAAIGPGIQSCHFAFRENADEAFARWPEAIERRDGRTFVDLRGIIQRELQEAGIPGEHMSESRACTYCERERYFSYRRDGKRHSVMLAFIESVEKQHNITLLFRSNLNRKEV